MIPPLPERAGGNRPYVAIKRKRTTVRPSPNLSPDATSPLADLLRAHASLTRIREQLLPGCSYDAVRVAVMRCASSDAFTQAMADGLPDALLGTVEWTLAAWRDQDPSVAAREKFRSLRQLIVVLDHLATTAATLHEARRA